MDKRSMVDQLFDKSVDEIIGATNSMEPIRPAGSSIGKRLVFFCSMGVNEVFYGVVVWLLWGWFVVPLGFVQLTILHAIGLGLTLTVLLNIDIISQALLDLNGYRSWSLEKIWEMSFGRAYSLGFSLFIGWVIHLWVPR